MTPVINRTREALDRTEEMLTALPIRPQLAPRSQPSSAAIEPLRPCATPWERKWLNLDVTHPHVQELASAVSTFAGRWFRNRPAPAVLVLTGGSGVGKTHAAKALCTFARHAALSAWEKGHWKTVPATGFYRWPEVVDGFKEGQYGVVADLFENDLVVLDDIGADHDPSSNGVDKLCQVLSRRENRFTVITTNIVMEAWANRFDVRVADRLCRNSTIIDLSDVGSYLMR